MDRFIFSIQKIFDIEEGCLKQNNVGEYYIGPYQRGYKWKSTSIDDHIPVLITDLYEAYCKSKERKGIKDYFLQYITVKRRLEDDNQFEVIDGQQRLTSLTLMFNVLEKKFNRKNITKNNNKYLVTYARYDYDIFDEIIGKVDSDPSEDKNLPQQDKFYMLKASRCFYSFFKILYDNNEEDLDGFLDYIKHNVKIILNKEDDYTSAEEVFANLNANKVTLTNSYLIKGLLLTKASRSNLNGTLKKHFKEIMDERAVMGRTWDEINSWLSHPEVASFFFGTEENGLEEMLKIIQPEEEDNQPEIIYEFENKLKDVNENTLSHYALFNAYNKNLTSPEHALKYLDKIKKTYKRLKSWYNDNLIYNLIGYKQFSRESNNEVQKVDFNKFPENIERLLHFPSNHQVKDDLGSHLKHKLPREEDIKTINYHSKKELSNLLLAINVFPKSIEDRNFRFDFYSYFKERWSFEHIYPQKPNFDDFDINNMKHDKQWIIYKIDKKLNELNEEHEEYSQLKRTKEKINNNININTSNIDFIFDEIEDVDDLGNMALLSGRVNAALNNGFFNTKRKILLNKISEGKFVPKHTIDIFSKMLHGNFTSSLTEWERSDINAHHKWIIKKIINLREQ